MKLKPKAVEKKTRKKKHKIKRRIPFYKATAEQVAKADMKEETKE